MAVTTYIAKSNSGTVITTFPFSTPNGSLTAWDTSTGVGSWTPNLDYTGSSTQEFQYQLACDGVEVLNTLKPVSFLVELPTATAVSDNVGNKTVGSTNNIDASLNDTPCSLGATTTYELAGNTNATSSIVGSIITYQPTGNGTFTVNYLIRCNGLICSSAQITGIGTTLPTASNYNKSTVVNTSVTIDVKTNSTTCS